MTGNTKKKMKEDLDKLFSQYLLGELSAEEKLEFEKNLENDADFKDKFDDYRIGMIAGERIQYKELESKVNSIIKDEKERKKQRNLKLIVGLIILLLSAVAIFYYTSKENNQPEFLYATYYKAPPYSVERGNSELDTIQQMKSNFAKTNWPWIIEFESKLSASQKTLPIIQSMIAHALLNANENEKAISLFKQIANNSDSTDLADNLYYIGLSYLKIREIDSSLVYLNKAISSKSYFPDKKDAETIIDKLKK